MPTYEELLKTFPNLETAIENNLINIIANDHFKKFTNKYSWKKYQNQKYNLKSLKKHKGNYGIIIGYNPTNRGYWLGCLDIDGVKKHPETGKDWEYVNQTKEDLFKIISQLKNVITIKTWSGGYHVYFLTKKSFLQEELLNINFPTDYHIKELQGKPITPKTSPSPSIELFTNNNRQVATAPSKIEENKKTGTYEVISDLKDFNKLKPYDNIVKRVTKLFMKNNYVYDEIEQYKTFNHPLTVEEKEKHEIKRTKNSVSVEYNDNDTYQNSEKGTKKLNKKQIEEISKALAPYFKKMEGLHSDLYMALSGYLKRNRVKESSTKQLVNKIMFLSNDTKKDHLREVISTYKRDNKNQTGLNKFKELLSKNKNINNNDLINSLILLKNNVSYKKPKLYTSLTQSKICTLSHTLEYYFKMVGNYKEACKLFCEYCENSEIAIDSVKSVLIKLNNLLKNDKEDFNKEIGNSYINTKNNHKSYKKLKTMLENTTKDENGKVIDELSSALKQDLILIRKIIQPVLALFNLTQRSRVKDITDSVKFLEKELTIKRTEDTHYFFNKKRGMYLELTYRELGSLIKNEYGYSLLDSDIKRILSGIQTIDKQDPYIWIFENGTLDIKTGIFTKGNNQEVFTSKKMGAIDPKTGEFKLFKYNPNVEIHPNWNYNEITLVQRTLQEILIPKNNKNYHDLYYDNLQRGGSYLLPINVFKKLAVYYNEGKGGKGRLKHLHESIMYDFLISTTPEQLLGDNFIDSDVLPNINLILVDEILRRSFLDSEDNLKRRVSGGRGIDSRKLGKSEVHRSDHNPAMEMYSNILFLINKDDPALLDRTDFLKLPNKFVDKKEDDLKPNEYVANKFIDEELSKDFKGLEWLANARVKAYLEMIKNNKSFMATQSALETLLILNKDNPIRAWFSTFIEHTGKQEDILYNSDIKLELIEYITESNIEYDTNNTQKISIDIGNWMKETYEPIINDDWDNIKERKTRGIGYIGFKSKTKEEIEKEYNVTYVIDEDTGVANRDNFYRLTDNEQRVFNKIKDTPYIHHKTLKKDFNKINIEDITKELEAKAFIKISKQQNISS